MYLGHGAPPLVDDALWVTQLSAWARALPRPEAILMVSAHWEAAPLTVGATRDGVPLVYDFYGFPERYYRATYPAPAAPGLAARVRDLLCGVEPVTQAPDRGLDHGAYVPLLAMYPEADVPVLQISMPSLDPARLLGLGARLRPLRDEGVLVIGSGFLTHGLPYLRDLRADAPPSEWSTDFDLWAADALRRGDRGRTRQVPRSAVCPLRAPLHGALRTAVRDPGPVRRRPDHREPDNGLLPGPLKALHPGRLSCGRAASARSGSRRAAHGSCIGLQGR